MSPSSPNSGYGQYTNFLAALVDSVLISLKTSTKADPKREELGRLLEALNNPHRDLQTYFVYTLLRSAVGDDAVDWQKLGHALVAQTTDAKTINLLERLAEVLQREQADNFSS